MIFLASLEIEKKDVQEEQDVNRLIYTQIIQHKSSDNISDDFLLIFRTCRRTFKFFEVIKSV